jgi:glutaminyl-peptide cyclotransferase
VQEVFVSYFSDSVLIVAKALTGEKNSASYFCLKSIPFMKKFLPFLLLPIASACNGPDKPPPDGISVPGPQIMSHSIVGTYPHDTSSYTQGLIIYKGDMYEGTGLEGRSKLMKVDIKTGKALQSINLDAKYFGEGVTILNDTVYQLTWKNKMVFVYTHTERF